MLYWSVFIVTTDQLKYFLELYRHQSINSASRNLNIAPQGLSKSLNKLEQELGCTLFERSHVGLVPTQEGICFHKTAYEMLDALSRFNENKASVRYFRECTFGYTSILTASSHELYAFLKDTCPQINIRIETFNYGDFDKPNGTTFPDIIFALQRKGAPPPLPEGFMSKKISTRPAIVKVMAAANASLSCDTHAVLNILPDKWVYPINMTAMINVLPNFMGRHLKLKDIYFAPCTNIFYDYILDKGYSSTTICIGEYSIIYNDFLLSNKVALYNLDPKISTIEFVLIYRKEFDFLYNSIADFLNNYYNL